MTRYSDKLRFAMNFNLSGHENEDFFKSDRHFKKSEL